MNNLMMKMYLVAKSLVEREEGQDLVEYALVVALIAFGAITGMGYLAKGLNTRLLEHRQHPHHQRVVSQPGTALFLPGYS